MSTTSTKKEITDYLWEWADERIGGWAKLLVKKILEEERPLVDEERKAIYDLFLETIDVVNIWEREKEQRPTYASPKNDLKLKSLTKIEGVNRLASEEALEFSPNVTVVYGENGTGKTGYSRILKAFGVSYDSKKRVLPNVYAKGDIKQSATIQYSLNGETKEFVWNGSNHTDSNDLHNTSVFNNNCVKLSLDSNRTLLVTPIGFHFFTILSNELRELETLHNEHINSFNTNITWVDKLHEGTRVFDAIIGLNHKSSKEEIDRLGLFTKESADKLKEHEEGLKKLNKELIETKLKGLRAQVSELAEVKSKILEARNTFTKDVWKSYQSNLKRLKDLEKSKKAGLNEIAKNRGIELYETEAFQKFIKTADEYIKKLGKEDYPNENQEVCIYCRQELTEPNAKELLKSYRELLKDTTGEEIKQVVEKLKVEKRIINNLSSNLEFHLPLFGQNENEKPIQPVFIADHNAKVRKYQELLKIDDETDIQAKSYDLSFKDLIEKLEEKETDILESITAKSETLANIAQKEGALKKLVNELVDAKLLSSNLEDTKKVIDNKISINALRAKSGEFQTAPISRKTTLARTELISDNFNNHFKEELRKIKPTKYQIELDFRTERGESKLVQYIQSQYELSEILSEGEQKAIALAEFLTELSLDSSTGPVVFDDPVTSLDHHIIDEVARRLINLSKTRQVVVFTHSILLFNSIKQKNDTAKYRKLDFNYYETEKDIDYTGYLHKSSELKKDIFTTYAKKINGLLGLSKEERSRRESELAIEGYSKLRSAIEVLVEKEVLHDTVRRYRKNVALTSFEKINGKLIEKHKEELNAIFEKCCGFTDAHSDPDELLYNPDLESLKLDLKTVKEIRDEFIN